MSQDQRSHNKKAGDKHGDTRQHFKLWLTFDNGKLYLKHWYDTTIGDKSLRLTAVLAQVFNQVPKSFHHAIKLKFDASTTMVVHSGTGTKDGIKEQSELYYEFAACEYYKLVLWLREMGIVRLASGDACRAQLHNSGWVCWDHARHYRDVSLTLNVTLQLRQHQHRACQAWHQAQGRGCIVLPTGAGKTILACQIMAHVNRSVMVVVPTLDLMDQWAQVITDLFSQQAGLWGGGKKQLADITIITYDSALHVTCEHGHRFGLVVFDECHHLAAPMYQKIARQTLAPYRLGLTATIEREDGQEAELDNLIGPVVYQASIQQMESTVLSPYDVITWRIPLSAKDRRLYDQEREVYLNYVRQAKISFQQKNSWQQFIFMASRSPRGRRALSAYRMQRRIACNSQSKIVALWQVFVDNPGEKILIFTQDNELAYQIGLRYFLPVLTHHTKKIDRRQFLENFRSGKLRCLVTSKVLNEGVDVPDASVGVVVSGTGSVREHVQRLGRILRHRAGKKAKLYELVSAQTGEVNTQYRRRSHDAYQRTT